MSVRRIEGRKAGCGPPSFYIRRSRSKRGNPLFLAVILAYASNLFHIAAHADMHAVILSQFRGVCSLRHPRIGEDPLFLVLPFCIESKYFICIMENSKFFINY